MVVEFREVFGDSEWIQTREGILLAKKGEDFMIRGVKGELYPIKKEIFNETYEVIPEPCGALSPTYKLPCTEPLGHKGNHKSDCFVWADSSGIILGEEEDRKLKGEMNE